MYYCKHHNYVLAVLDLFKNRLLDSIHWFIIILHYKPL